MRHVLRNALRGIPEERHAGTINALVVRGLLTASGELTESGRREALLLVPLAEQCTLLGVPLEDTPNPDTSLPPEIALWTRFTEFGYTGSYCEGGAILILLRAAALDLLARLNTFGSRSDASTRFTEAQFSIQAAHSKEVVSTIRSAEIGQVRKNFSEIYSSSFVRDSYPSLTEDGIVALFEAIGGHRLARIAEALFEDPYEYRNGWPDLTMVKEHAVMWVEVKTTDKLHMSQIVTFQRMVPILPGTVKVVHLT
jgi:hypothetical protein